MRPVSVCQNLYDGGVGMNAETNETEFISILNNRSFGQLRLTFDEYENIAQESIEESVKKEFSGDLLDGLVAIGHLCCYSCIICHTQP